MERDPITIDEQMTREIGNILGECRRSGHLITAFYVDPSYHPSPRETRLCIEMMRPELIGSDQANGEPLNGLEQLVADALKAQLVKEFGLRIHDRTAYIQITKRSGSINVSELMAGIQPFVKKVFITPLTDFEPCHNYRLIGPAKVDPGKPAS